MKTIEYKGEQCYVKFKSYPNGRPYITLVSVKDGIQIARATVNINSRVDTKYVFIKDYSENKGIYQALIDSEVIWLKDGKIEIGFEYAYVCKIRLCAICDKNNSIPNLCGPCAKEIIKKNTNAKV